MFHDKRPVCQSFSAIRLSCAIVTLPEAVDTLRLNVRIIEQQRLWLKGGQLVGGDLVVHRHCTLIVRLEHEDCEYFPSDGEDDSSPFSDDDREADPDDVGKQGGQNEHANAEQGNASQADDSGASATPADRPARQAGGRLWGRLLAALPQVSLFLPHPSPATRTQFQEGICAIQVWPAQITGKE